MIWDRNLKYKAQTDDRQEQDDLILIRIFITSVAEFQSRLPDVAKPEEVVYLLVLVKLRGQPRL